MYDAAMRFLKDGDAWIIDLRGNGGGTSAAAQYFSSHFFDPGTVTYVSYAGSAPPERSGAIEHLPAGRLKGKPLYVLIDGNVGSAAEAVAYNLQQFKLAELVGTRTAGAANNNKLLPVAPNFILSISYGRPLHVLTNSNWDGVGVAPNVECPPQQALEMARSLALKRLAASNAPPDQLAEYKWFLTAAEALLSPVRTSAIDLTKLTGKYGKTSEGYGELTIKLDDGTLWLERPERPRSRLIPLNKDGLFAIEGNDLLRARITEKAVELLWWNDPQPRLFLRS
ncbi:MAG: S41 family peptidase [Pyrinomonadaceae bacterium]